MDSNVWVWLGYSKASMTGRPYQTREYPGYVARVATAGGKLRRTAYTLGEASHVVEKLEHAFFKKLTGAEVSLKEWRHEFPTERATVVSEIQAMWGAVKSLSHNVVAATSDSFLDGALAEISAAEVDAYDGFIVRLAKQFNFTGIITDDADLATAAGVTIFTANRAALIAARTQGKLTNR